MEAIANSKVWNIFYFVSKYAMLHAICNMLYTCQLAFRICGAVVGPDFGGGRHPHHST